jgi:hypothetical protein
MRFIKWAVAVAATSSLVGCFNSQPSVYRVAVDTLSAQNLPATCYRAGNAPTNITDKVTNIVDEKQWVTWEGIEDAVYFEPGNINYAMGEARNVNITGDAILGGKNDDGKNVFTSERTLRISDTETHTTSATYNFEKLGTTLQGTLTLHSACAGTGCNTSPTCDVTLNFSGRQIDGDQNIQYGNGSGG